jgi:hypothetical protein
VNIGRVARAEEHQKAAIGVSETAVQLDGQSVGLFSDEVVIVYADSMSAHELVAYDVDFRLEIASEHFCHRSADSIEDVASGQIGSCGRCAIPAAELVLLIEVGPLREPRRVALKPLEHVFADLRRETLSQRRVSKRSLGDLADTQIWPRPRRRIECR